MFFLAVIITALFLSLLLVPCMINLANKRNIIDMPSGTLKTHTQPTPYLGGVAVYLSITIASLLFFQAQLWLMLFLTGTGFLCITGLMDDIFTLDPKTKFLTQSAGCVTLIIALTAATGITPPLPIIGLSLFFMFTIVNAVNLVDIMDALAATACLTALIGSACLSWMTNSLVFTLELTAIGALLGFLWYNRKPAQIYLGDAGSLTLGGALGFVVLFHSWQETLSYDYFMIPSLAGIVLIELIYLMIIRTAKGLPVYLGSPHHFALYLKRQNWSWGAIISFVFIAGMSLNTLIVGYKLAYISFTQTWIMFLVGLLVWTYIIYCRSSEATQSQDRT